MARKVFVSYKHSDSVDTRDRIIRALGSNGTYYKGEKGYKALEYADSTLKQYLAEKIYDSSVTVVIISKNVISSNWVDWEIKYSLERHSRLGRTSKRNGIVCVVQKCIDYSSPKYGYYGQYNKNSKWAYNQFTNGRDLKQNILPKTIWRNMKDSFRDGTSYRGYLLSDSSNTDRKDYCIVVSEDTFCSNPDKYIELAYERSKDDSYVTVTR